MTIGGDLRDLRESCVAQQPHHQVAALRDAPIFCRDGGLMDPLLEPVDELVMMLRDLGLDRLDIGDVGPTRPPREGERGRSRGALEEHTPIDPAPSLIVERRHG